MTGGPAFGPPPRMQQAAFIAAAITFIAIIAWLMCGCTTHSYLYRPVPADLIPERPELPSVQASELQCLSDDAYSRLANRDRIRQQYEDSLRALLEQ